MKRLDVLALIGLSGALTFGCGEGEPLGPRGRDLDSAGKPSSGNPTVTATDPNNAAQGVTLDVRVLGSNFDRGSKAEFALECETGCVVAEKVKTNSTQFVNQGELVANITIAADADTALYDVLVTTSKGKRGIGIELFAVKLGHPNPQTGYSELVLDRLAGASTCEGIAINEQSDAVGFCSYKKSARHAFFWNAGSGLKDLGVGMAEDVSDGGGPVVVGRSGLENPRPLVWEPNSGTGSVELQPLSVNACPGGVAYGVNGAGDLVAGYTCEVVSGATQSIPVVWARSGTTWGDPERLPVAAGYRGGQAVDVSTNGVILGYLVPEGGGPGTHFFVWFPPYVTAERLPPGGYTYIFANAINDNGDVAGTNTEVGGWRSLLWKRVGAGWDPPLDIGTGAGHGITSDARIAGFTGRTEVYIWSAATGQVDLGAGLGYGVNDRGDIVGTYTMNERTVLWLAPR